MELLLEATGAAGSCGTGLCWGERELQEWHERAPRAGRLPGGGAGQPEGLFTQVTKSCTTTRGWSSSRVSCRGSRAAAPSALPAPPRRRAAAARAGGCTRACGCCWGGDGTGRGAGAACPTPAAVTSAARLRAAGPAPPRNGATTAQRPAGPGAGGGRGLPACRSGRCSARRLAAVPAGQVFCETPALLEASTSWSAARSEQIPDTWGLCNGTKGEPGQASSL